MNKKNNLIVSVLTILIGALFCIFKGGVIGIAMTVLGVLLIVTGILAIINGSTVPGVVFIVVGAVVIVFGWLLASIVLYVVAVLLIIYGILEFVNLIKMNVKGTTPFNTFVIYLVPTFKLLIGTLLLFNQGGTIDWIFLVAGILLIVDGTIGLLSEQIK